MHTAQSIKLTQTFYGGGTVDGTIASLLHNLVHTSLVEALLVARYQSRVTVTRP